MEARFIFNKKALLEQLRKLKDLGLKISYSYKTNRFVGNALQDISDCDFSIQSEDEINKIKDKSRIWFFTQAQSKEELINLIKKETKNFVVDNEVDLERLLKAIEEEKIKINLSLRMKFQEHRIGSGKYFVYGMSSDKINKIIYKIKDNTFIGKLGIHIHRKSQNTNEWEIKEELQDSLTKESLERINFVNLGGGLPVEYRGYTSKILPYIFGKILDAKNFLESFNILTYIEPGRFLAAPSMMLEAEIIQIQGKTIVINTTIYNCALDNVLTGTKMLVKQELGDKSPGEFYTIKGNSPTRDDIFRYKVKLDSPKLRDKILFLNAGAYNYSTDFFGYKKLPIKSI